MINPNASAKITYLGKDKIPLLVIDDLLENPDSVVEFSASQNWEKPKTSFYPGIIAQLPDEYMTSLKQLLGSNLIRAFGFDAAKPINLSGFFALTTYELDEFGPWQRIPHFDNVHSNHVAMVHYLGKNQTGGTGFFKHLNTGFESISHENRDEYLGKVSDFIDANGQMLQWYTGPLTPGYEMYFDVPFKFNRAIIYPSYILHCALYDGTQANADPYSGRLTANTFWFQL